MIQRVSFRRNPNIGVFCRASDKFAIIPKNSPKVFYKVVKETLDVEIHSINISGTSLLGAMISMNNNGLVLPRNVYRGEVEEFKELDVKVSGLKDRATALGNLVIANDYGVIVSPKFSRESIAIIKDTLDVEVDIGSIGGYSTIGAVGIATNNGALFHPLIKEEELEWVKEVLKVDADVGTVNRGVGFVRTGIVANSKGAIIGQETTGPEIARIEDVLGFLG